MGYTSLVGIASAVDRRTSLQWHLQHNHFPPVPVFMVPVCEAAIDACLEGDDERPVDLPEGLTWRGRSSAPAWAVVEGHHLEYYLDEEVL
jgi:hypothetical protein